MKPHKVIQRVLRWWIMRHWPQPQQQWWCPVRRWRRPERWRQQAPVIGLYNLGITQLFNELFNAGSKVIIGECIERVVDDQQDYDLNG